MDEQQLAIGQYRCLQMLCANRFVYAAVQITLSSKTTTTPNNTLNGVHDWVWGGE
jgi:hypothetical protein